MIEVWKPVCSFEDLYEISSFGNFKRLSRVVTRKDGTTYRLKEKIRIVDRTKNYYPKVRLKNEKYNFEIKLHILVAIHFIPNYDNKPEVNHKDGNKSNPHVGNLEWVTTKENVQHAFRTGLKKNSEAVVFVVELNKTFESVTKACNYLKVNGYPNIDINKIYYLRSRNKTIMNCGLHFEYVFNEIHEKEKKLKQDEKKRKFMNIKLEDKYINKVEVTEQLT